MGEGSGTLLDGEFEIFGQRIDAATGAEVGPNDFLISDMGPNASATADGFDAFSPAVAYNTRANTYLVVWQGDDNLGNLADDEFEVFGQLLRGDGSAFGLDDFRISDMGPTGDRSFTAEAPAVSYNATDDQFLVVWQGTDAVAGEFEIFGQRLTAIGAQVGTNDFRISDMGPDGNVGFSAAAPELAHNTVNDEYVVVWFGEENTTPLVDGEVEIFGQRLNAASGTEVGPNDFRISDMGPNGNTGFFAAAPDVAYDVTAGEYLVVWNGDDDTAPLVDQDIEIFGQRLAGATATPVGDDDFRISDLGPDGTTNILAMAPAVAYDATNDEHLVVWNSDDFTSSPPPPEDGRREIFGQRLAAGAVGEFTLTPPHATVDAREGLNLDLTWIHPGVWRDLDTIDLRIVRDSEPVFGIRWEETPNTFRLFRKGEFGHPFNPGSGAHLETEWARLTLRVAVQRRCVFVTYLRAELRT